MAKKITKIGITPTSMSSAATPKTVTPVRGTAIPKTAPSTSKGQITYDMIAKRAYEIWQSGTGGSEFDNWVRAERELRGM